MSPVRLGLLSGTTFAAVSGGGVVVRRVLEEVPSGSAWVSIGSTSRSVASWIPISNQLHIPAIFRSGSLASIARRSPFRQAIFRTWYSAGAGRASVDAARFFERHGVESIWCIAAGLAIPVAAQLAQHFRLHATVHDHHRGHVTPDEGKWLDQPMRDLLLVAKSIDFASQGLKDAYAPLSPLAAQADVLLTGGGDPVRIFERKPPRRASDPVTVLFAGSTWARDALEQLVLAVEMLRTSGVRITVRAFCQRPRFARDGESIEWHPPISQDALDAELATADIAYVPMSFSERYQLLASTSFPSKLVHFFQRSVPVLVHAPDYSSVARDSGVRASTAFCTELSARTLADRLLDIARDPARAHQLAVLGRELYLSRFAPGVVCERYRVLLTGSC